MTRKTTKLFLFLGMLVAFALTSQAHAAINFDNASSGWFTAASTTLVFPFTVTSSANSFLTLEAFGTNGGSDLIATATYNGVPMTLAGRTQVPGDRWMTLWYLLGAAAGSNNFSIGASASDVIGADAASYAGVGAFDGIATSSKSGATSSTLTITTTQNNDWLLFYAKSTGNGLIAATGTTVRKNSGGLGVFDSNGPLTPAGAKSSSIIVNPSDNLGSMMIAFSPLVAGATTGGRNNSQVITSDW